jgi:hypothetical protein
MPKKSLSPGDFVQAFCTRCKEVLRHKIMALVEGVPVRVKCNTCEGEHAFRGAAEAASRASEGRPERRKEKAPGSAAKTRRGANTLAAEWEAQLAAAKGRTPRRYVPAERFKAAEVIDHPSFGAGVVQRVLEPGKILVLFASGTKTLVCGKA